MFLEQAQPIADEIIQELEPYCLRIAVAGSVRRKKPEVGDIEIVLIPDTDPRKLQALADAVWKWKRIKGAITGRYTQVRHPSGIKVDIFVANPDNWGLIYAIRTGSARFSHRILAAGWVAKGYHSKDGVLYRGLGKVYIREEEELFKLIGRPYVEPERRE